MKAEEVLGMLRAEIGLEDARLKDAAGIIGSAEDDGAIMAAVDQYAETAARIASAGENIGLAAVGVSAGAMQAIVMMAPVLEPAQRTRATAVLAQWPQALCAWLEAPASGEARLALASLTDAIPDILELCGVDASAHNEALLTVPDFSQLLSEGAPARPSVATAEDVSLALPADLDRKLYDAFLLDAPDQAAELSRLLDRLAKGKASEEDVVNARRIAHTFKGSANIIGIAGLANLAHHTEDVLDAVARAPSAAPAALTAVLQRAAGCIEAMTYSLLGAEPRPADSQSVLQSVLDWANAVDRGDWQEAAWTVAASELVAPAVIEPAIVQAETVRAPAAPDVAKPVDVATPQAMIRVPLISVEEMLRLAGENAVSLAALRATHEHIASVVAALDDQLLRLSGRLSALELIVDVRGPAALAQRTGERSAEFDALELDHYSDLHVATRALAESVADSRRQGRELGQALHLLDAQLSEGAQIQDELQFHTLAMRRTPLGSLSARLQRTVRQAAAATGKDVRLDIVGDTIEVDSDIVNHLADPLLHLLRNAVDHGIETPAIRAESGKPAEGCITLRYQRTGPQVTVTCQDDGAGLDYGRIRAKAAALGVLPDGACSEDALARLILLPGFTTRESVTEISGRGIGMDVVRERIERLGGTIQISSTAARGTLIAISLQASSATVFACIAEIEGQRIAVPTHTLAACIASGQFTVSHDAAAGEWALNQADKTLPLRTARGLLGYATEFESAHEFASRPVMLVKGEGGDVAVAADRLLGVQELFLRPVGEFFRTLPGFFGAALMGDGAVVPVVDLPALLRAPLPEMPAEHRTAALAQPARRRVLAVDDSQSVREMLGELLKDAGYEVVLAADGLAALRELETFRPDVILTDLEMPNINGLELTAHIRRDAALAEVPIVMITSRSQDKHRQQAIEAGVTEYLTKPYTEQHLLEVVGELVAAGGVMPEAEAA